MQICCCERATLPAPRTDCDAGTLEPSNCCNPVTLWLPSAQLSHSSRAQLSVTVLGWGISAIRSKSAFRSRPSNAGARPGSARWPRTCLESNDQAKPAARFGFSASNLNNVGSTCPCIKDKEVTNR